MSELPILLVSCWNITTRRPASTDYFLPKCTHFDQLLQTVKNETTVLILSFKEFLQTSIPPLISVLYAKGYHDFPLENFCLTVPKNFVEEPFCVSENFWYRKMLVIREGRVFRQNCFVSVPKKIRRGTLLCFTKFLVSKKVMDKGGGGGSITIFCQFFFSHSIEKLRGGTLLFQKNSGIEKLKNFMDKKEGGRERVS